MSIRMRRRENAAGKFNRQLGKYPGKISGENIPGRPNRQFLELWKMPRGFEAVSRANLFAGPGIGTKYLSIRRQTAPASPSTPDQPPPKTDQWQREGINCPP